MSTETKLTIEIKNRQPVELLDLTNSFMSLADEYRRFVQAFMIKSYSTGTKRETIFPQRPVTGQLLKVLTPVRLRQSLVCQS